MKIYTKELSVTEWKHKYNNLESNVINEIINDNKIDESLIYQSTFEFIDSNGQYGVSNIYELRLYVRGNNDKL